MKTPIQRKESPAQMKRRRVSLGSSDRKCWNLDEAHKGQQMKHFVEQGTKAVASLNPEFPKLDPNDPVHSNRIHQRRKAIMKGKSTVGYDEYVKKIPPHQRRKRSMETPFTPDHTLDIPAKRWNGLVRAWRLALHKYDPPELVSSFTIETSQSTISKETSVSEDSTMFPATPVQPKAMRVMQDAATEGILVNVSLDYKLVDESSPISILSCDSQRTSIEMKDFPEASGSTDDVFEDNEDSL